MPASTNSIADSTQAGEDRRPVKEHPDVPDSVIPAQAGIQWRARRAVVSITGFRVKPEMTKAKRFECRINGVQAACFCLLRSVFIVAGSRLSPE